jgi:preprotein translocase subunit SecE
MRGCPMNKIIRFFQESYAELKKVTWPSREDVSASTRIVIISTALIAMALGLVDFLIYQAIQLIF